jgi:hypothetical protein
VSAATVDAPAALSQPDLEIIGLDGKTAEELAWELHHGARFVRYRYCVSVLVLTLMQPSPVYFIPHNRGTTEYALRYNLLSLLAGWWGFPWGPISTMTALVTNFNGGTDVTADVVGYLQLQGRLPKDFSR